MLLLSFRQCCFSLFFCACVLHWFCQSVSPPELSAQSAGHLAGAEAHQRHPRVRLWDQERSLQDGGRGRAAVGAAALVRMLWLGHLHPLPRFVLRVRPGEGPPAYGFLSHANRRDGLTSGTLMWLFWRMCDNFLIRQHGRARSSFCGSSPSLCRLPKFMQICRLNFVGPLERHHLCFMIVCLCQSPGRCISMTLWGVSFKLCTNVNSDSKMNWLKFGGQRSKVKVTAASCGPESNPLTVWTVDLDL